MVTQPKYTTVNIPHKITNARSVVDYSRDYIYIIGAFANPNILTFNIKSQKYESNDLIPNYNTININPDWHCVIPLFDNNNKIQSILSFGGDTSDHFSLLERNESRFEWNTNPLCNQSLPYPNVGYLSRAVNINNSLVCVY